MGDAGRGGQVAYLVNNQPPNGISREAMAYNPKAAQLIKRTKVKSGTEEGIEEREAKMGDSSAFVVLIGAILALHIALASSAVDFSGGDLHQFQLGWIPARSACDGSIAECLAGEEFEMDSEINRRILATKKYISYGALSRNTVPCSRRGSSYYNCQHGGGQANPYTRGCSTITRCRR